VAYGAMPSERTPLTAKSLLHLGSRAATDQALSRLTRQGKLMRSGRGTYVRPIESRFGNRLPSPVTVITETARLRGETGAPHGAAAANRLGLTTQVPMHTIYLTSGRSRRLTLGAQSIELEHAPRWQLTNADRPSGEVVRALAWAGRPQAHEFLARIKQKLPEEVRKELIAARGALPEWLARTISAELAV
jgi:Family of unknown function (DUF6088)